MEVVVDANILFSSIIKDSLTAKLICKKNIKVYAPRFLIEEFLKYEPLILKKTHRAINEYIQILHILNELITFIPLKEFSDFIEEAKRISPDEKDIAYIALALKLRCGIWSNDKKLKEQSRVKVYSTEDMKRFQQNL